MVKFFCNDDKLLEQAKKELDKISFGFIPRAGKKPETVHGDMNPLEDVDGK